MCFFLNDFLQVGLSEVLNGICDSVLGLASEEREREKERAGSGEEG